MAGTTPLAAPRHRATGLVTIGRVLLSPGWVTDRRLSGKVVALTSMSLLRPDSMYEKLVDRVRLMLYYGADISQIHGALLLEGLDESAIYLIYQSAKLLQEKSDACENQESEPDDRSDGGPGQEGAAAAPRGDRSE